MAKLGGKIIKKEILISYNLFTHLFAYFNFYKSEILIVLLIYLLLISIKKSNKQ